MFSFLFLLCIQPPIPLTSYESKRIKPDNVISSPIAILSNSIEAVVLLLAAGSIGAIFSSAAPDLGASGIVSRFEQIRPKILFVDSEVLYAGKRRILHKKLKTAVTQLRDLVPELEKVVVVLGSTSFLEDW